MDKGDADLTFQLILVRKGPFVPQGPVPQAESIEKPEKVLAFREAYAPQLFGAGPFLDDDLDATQGMA